jgi:post-segregation antitoxin (ccd killing protein)
MGQKMTSCLVDEEILEEAKALKIPIGKTLEDALKEKLGNNSLVEDKKRERKRLLSDALKLKREIDELESRQKAKIDSMGEEEERYEKALRRLEEINDKYGGLTPENFRGVATVFEISPIKLEDIWKLKNRGDF